MQGQPNGPKAKAPRGQESKAKSRSQTRRRRQSCQAAKHQLLWREGQPKAALTSLGSAVPTLELG